MQQSRMAQKVIKQQGSTQSGRCIRWNWKFYHTFHLQIVSLMDSSHHFWLAIQHFKRVEKTESEHRKSNMREENQKWHRQSEWNVSYRRFVKNEVGLPCSFVFPTFFSPSPSLSLPLLLTFLEIICIKKEMNSCIIIIINEHEFNCIQEIRPFFV